jgi:diketogulonate reductase-like aldo/keto reductase
MLYQQANPGEMEQVVKEAIDAGYRHFDTALFYQNEKEVGAGIRAKIAEGVIRREDVFVTTKVRLEERNNPVRFK